MGRWVAGIGIALIASASPAVAQKAFDVVPRTDHAAYAAIARLDARGYFAGTGGSFTAARDYTRYEFAVAVERLTSAIRARVLSADDPSGLRDDLRDYGTLIQKFQREIKALGPDVDELQGQIDVLRQRVERLEASAQPGPDLSAKLARPRSYGALSALKAQRVQNWMDSASRSGIIKAPFTRSFQPQIRAGAGGVGLSVQVEDPDRLASVQRMPLQDPADVRAYRARLDMPLGGFTLSAFYLREGSFTDRYMLANPYGITGRSVGYGGAVSGALLDNVNFLLESASIRSLDDDAARAAVSFRAGLNYEMGRGLRLGAAFEQMRQFGAPGLTTDLATYTLFVERSWGRNTTFSVIYRYFNPNSGNTGAGVREGDASTLLQTSVRF